MEIEMGGLYGDIFNNSYLTDKQINERALRFSQEHKEWRCHPKGDEWIRDLLENSKISKVYHETKKDLDDDTIQYQKFLNILFYFLLTFCLKDNKLYRLYKTKEINLWGPLDLNRSPIT